MLLSIGWGTFLFFGAFCLAAGVFSFFFVPETSHKSLEQIAAVFGDNDDEIERQLWGRIEREIWVDAVYDTVV